MDYTVGSYEAKTHLPELLERASHGEDIIVTKRGKPLARITAIEPKEDAKRARAIAAAKRLLELREGTTLGGHDWRKWRDEGRA